MTITSALLSELRFGDIIVCSLQSIPDVLSVDVDLVIPGDDMALTVMVNWSKNRVERFITQNGKVQHLEIEENMEPSAPPLPGKATIFRVAIICDDNHYRIWISDKPFCHFSYYIPCKDVKSVRAGTDGLHRLTQLDHRRTFPSPWPVLQYDEADQDFSYDIPVPIKSNYKLVIKGQTVENKDRKTKDERSFVISHRIGDGGQEILHFLVNFKQQKISVKGMKQMIAYEPEKVYSGKFPFKFGEKFQIGIIYYHDRFGLGVSGAEIFDFQYLFKKTLETLTGCRILSYGDLSVIVEDIEYGPCAIEECIDFDFADFNAEKKPETSRGSDCDSDDKSEDGSENIEDCREYQQHKESASILSLPSY